ncbi:type 1 periplasmic binding fold superfamily protein [Neolewinella sp.]|uniref:type 1 periplasmic binding fold superfamily protein n=1 Tax=Neolewinella sp. TaxID=2993543 RepID=UPI003B519D69
MPKFAILLLLLVVVLYASCGNDDGPVIENEEEVITDLVYTLVPTGGGQAVTMAFRDPDGDGGQAPTLTVSDSLQTDQTYSGTIVLTNASDPTDVEDITAEIRTEALDHQFFYIPSSGLTVTPAYADSDAQSNPIGLLTTLRTADASSGELRIVLRHKADKRASGVTITDPAGAGGETDIEVTFPVSVR